MSPERSREILEDYERRVKRAVEEEREACAQLIDDERVRRQATRHWSEATLALRDAARLIRARSHLGLSCEDVFDGA